jgi:hypothetical protein
MIATRALYRGPAHVCVAICDEFKAQVGDFTGMPVREQFPQLTGHGVFEAMDTVYLTGEPIEMPWPSVYAGVWGTLLILPWERDGEIVGVGCHHYPLDPARSLPRIVAQASAVVGLAVPVLVALL